MTRWLFLLLFPFCAQSMELPSAWQHWQYSRAVQMPAAASEWVRFTLPPDIYGPAQGSLADLRLIDRSGKETPYLLHARQEQCQRIWRSAPLSDTGFTPGRYSQAVIDAGSDGSPHNAVEITTGQKDFFTWTEIAASDDRVTWRIVREKAPFYAFDGDRLNSGEILGYPLTRSRWLRLRFLQGKKALLASSARITQEIRTEAEYMPLNARFQLAPRQDAQEDSWQTDRGQNLPPVSAFHIESSQQEFHRGVRISASDDGKNWRHITHGHIYRHTATLDARQRAVLEISFPESHAKFWRVSVLNHNDPALPDLQISLLTIPRHVAFRRETVQDYHLLYGNPRAMPAQYELAQLSNGAQWKNAPLATLGKEIANTAYVSPAPWSERHPWLLWSALITAVSMLGWIAINALRHGNAGIRDKAGN